MLQSFLKMTLVSACLFCGAPASAEIIPGSGFYFGAWKGFAVRDESRNLILCQVSSGEETGETVDFSLWSDNRLAIVLSPKGAQYTRGQTFNTTFKTDVSKPIAVPAQVLNETSVTVTFTDIEWTIAYLKDAGSLEMSGIGAKRPFPIIGADEALALAVACLEKYAAPDANSGAGSGSDGRAP